MFRIEEAKDTAEKVNKASMLASYLYAEPSILERLSQEGHFPEAGNHSSDMMVKVEELSLIIEGKK